MTAALVVVIIGVILLVFGILNPLGLILVIIGVVVAVVDLIR